MPNKEIDMQKWAQDVIFVQDACNLSGVVHSFSRFMHEMAEAGYGTTQRNTHPITRLFVDKLYDLAFLSGHERGGFLYREAYDKVKELAG